MLSLITSLFVFQVEDPTCRQMKVQPHVSTCANYAIWHTILSYVSEEMLINGMRKLDWCSQVSLGSYVTRCCVFAVNCELI